MALTHTAAAIPDSFTVKLTEAGGNDLAMIAGKLGLTYDEALSRAVGTLAVIVEEDAEVILKYKNGAKQTLPIRGDNAGHSHD